MFRKSLPDRVAHTVTCPAAIDRHLSGLTDREAIAYLREVVADLIGCREGAAARWRGVYPALSPAESRICALLHQRLGQVVAWDSILSALLADSVDAATTQKTLVVHVHRIRRKAPDVVIATVRGYGLRMQDAGLAVQP